MNENALDPHLTYSGKNERIEDIAFGVKILIRFADIIQAEFPDRMFMPSTWTPREAFETGIAAPWSHAASVTLANNVSAEGLW